MGFATDLTIHRVFKSDPRLEHALREEFLDHVRGYARYQQCTPCPVEDWVADNSNIWGIESPGRDTGDPALHFIDRLLLYAAAMERSWNDRCRSPVFSAPFATSSSTSSSTWSRPGFSSTIRKAPKTFCVVFASSPENPVQAIQGHRAAPESADPNQPSQIPRDLARQC
jgi:hypothetical protein